MHKRWGLLLIFLMGMAGAVWAATEPSRLAAPDFKLKTRSGEIITKASLAGKPTLLVFWDTWCGVCRREMPNVNALYEEKKGKGLQVVAIGFSDLQSNIDNYVQDHADTFTFPVAYDVKNGVSTAFVIRATPTFFLLDKEGRIVHVHVGGGFLRDPVFLEFFETL